jgi:hypothetical protein
MKRAWMVIGAVYSLVVHANCEEHQHVSSTYLYPHAHFYKVEELCRQLWTDVDMAITNTSFLENILSESNSFKNQLVYLSRLVHLLVHDTENFYLPEDVAYLIIIVGMLAAKFKHIDKDIINADDQKIMEYAQRDLMDLFITISSCVSVT